MLNIKNKKLILFPLILVLALCGCNKDGNVENNTNINASDTESQNKSAQNEINIGVRYINTLNPITNCDESIADMLKLVYMPLVAVGSDERALPYIAKTWSFSNEGKSITLDIGGSVFHDNSSITADDVAYTVSAIRSAPDETYYKNCVSNITSCTRVSRDIVKIDFATASLNNLYYLNFPIIKSGYFSEENKLTSMGTGPYSVSAVVPASKVVLKGVSGTNGFNPEIKTVNVINTKNKDTELYSFGRNIINVTNGNEAQLGKYGIGEDIKKYEFITDELEFIGINFNNSLLQDKNIRQAIAYAIPEQKITESVYLNCAVKATSVIKPTSFLYAQDVPKYDYNINLAKILLSDSGFTDINDDKIKEKVENDRETRLAFNLLVNNENKERLRIAEILKEELYACGIEIIIDKVPFDEYQNRINNKKYDLFIGGYKLSPVHDFNFLLNKDLSDTATYSSEFLNYLLTTANSAVTEDAAINAYSNLQKNIAHELPIITLVFKKSAIYINGGFHGNLKPVPENIFDGLHTVKFGK